MAALPVLLERGALDRDERIVLFNTGAGLKYPEVVRAEVIGADATGEGRPRGGGRESNPPGTDPAPRTGFEDRAAHQDGYASSDRPGGTGTAPHYRRLPGPAGLAGQPGSWQAPDMASPVLPTRLTQYAHGGGCACKIPPGELEEMVAGLTGGVVPAGLVVGLDTGDDAAVLRIPGGQAVVSTVDFFTPVVDDPFDWGRIAAANALSDVYAMGGRPVLGVNLLCWPREVLPLELAREVLRGGLAVAGAAGVPLAGGHSVDDPEPKYGLAVTGLADPDRLLRNDAGRPGLPLTLTKPLGVGVLNSRHKATGEVFPQAVATMTELNEAAASAALAAGARCATDITGFGLLGHLFKLARASGVTAVLDPAAVPYLDGAREALRAGHVSGGTRRNLDWVAPHTRFGPQVSEEDRLLLADAQTSGGLIVAGEVPGYPVVGELVAAGEATLVVG